VDALTRWQAKAAVTFVIALIVMVVGAGLLYLVFVINPVHRDPEKVPSTVSVAETGPHTASVERTRRLARQLLVKENIPGLSMAVAIDGKVVWAEGFGYANVERREALTPNSRFHLGSVSKTLTAAGVALLHDRGQLDLDAPVQKYVPSYPQKTWTVTPRQLLGDIAGVHKIRGDNNDQPPFGRCQNLDEALELFANEPLLFKPGTAYRFASNGWVLLSAVIEGAAREPFSAFMSREVFGPLGMTRTMLDGAAPNSDLVSVFDPGTVMLHNLGIESDPPPPAEYSCFAGAGAFLSTPSDLVRLGSAMLNPGLLKAETLEVFQTPQQLESGASTGFALGWAVNSIPFGGVKVRVLRHRATPFGGGVSLTIFPEGKMVIAAAANGAELETVDALVLEAAEAFAAIH